MAKQRPEGQRPSFLPIPTSFADPSICMSLHPAEPLYFWLLGKADWQTGKVREPISLRKAARELDVPQATCLGWWRRLCGGNPSRIAFVTIRAQDRLGRALVAIPWDEVQLTRASLRDVSRGPKRQAPTLAPVPAERPGRLLGTHDTATGRVYCSCGCILTYYPGLVCKVCGRGW